MVAALLAGGGILAGLCSLWLAWSRYPDIPATADLLVWLAVLCVVAAMWLDGRRRSKVEG